jgi:hypothetical protein
MNRVILLAFPILFFIFPEEGNGQITDDFESGDISSWTQSPENRWKADSDNPLSGAYSLHHSFDNTGSGCDLIGLSLKNIRPEKGTTTWSFRIRYGYDPSSTNNWVVFLMSDIDPGSITSSSGPSGYAVGVNQDGYDDTLKLWKTDKGRFITVIKSRLNWQIIPGSAGSAKINVVRSETGNWNLTVWDENNVLIDSSSGYDAGLYTAGWFIISYNYTATRDMLLWFDNLIISGIFSDEPPEQEPVIGPGDIIITEIMAKPQPAVSLPGKEFLEILNDTPTNINMSGWELSTASQAYRFPNVTLNSQQYMILCQASDTGLFAAYGKTAGFSPFPALTDGGREIAIINNQGKLIDGLEYSSKWYRNEIKSDGGWSLEIIDTSYPFSGAENWRASISSTGGTPGAINSVAGSSSDLFFKGIENAFPADSSRVMLKISETVPDLIFNVSDVTISDNEIYDIKAADLLLREYEIRTSKTIDTGKTYHLSIGSGIQDFAGNPAEKNSFDFGIPQLPVKGDIRFNELLFNPLPGDPDFVELANCSVKIIDVYDLRVVSVRDETKDTSDAIRMSAEHRCLLPGELYAVTTDKQKLSERYFSSDAERIFEIPSLPSMPDDKGHLILFNLKLDVIDEVYYSDKLQYSLLQNDEGVSLEKVGSEYSSADGSYWQSASESSGWGTPGAPNSILYESHERNEDIKLSSGMISPDNDGYEDFLVLDMKLKGTHRVVSVWVFDEAGFIVKKLTNNLLIGPETSIVWNGTADDGSIVGTGIYILFIRAFDETGRVRHWKKVCAVVR